MTNTHRFSVLLVEDTEDDEKLAVRALHRTGLPLYLRVARDGQEALNMLFTELSPEAEIPQLVLLDIKLPKISGIEVLRQIRTNPETAWLPVVMMTSSDEECDVRDCYRLHANSYLKKPVEYEAFMESICVVARYWLTVNILP